MPQNLAEECVGSRTANTIAALANARESMSLGYAAGRYTTSDMLPVLNGLLDALRAGHVPNERELAMKSMSNASVVAAAINALPGAIEGGHAPEFLPFAHLFGAGVPDTTTMPSEEQPAPQPPTPQEQAPDAATATAALPDALSVQARIGGGLIILVIVGFLIYRAVR